MPDRSFPNEVRQVPDEVYRDCETATVREAYAYASHVAAGMLARLNKMPEGA